MAISRLLYTKGHVVFIAVFLASILLSGWAAPQQAGGATADTFTTNLPLVFNPVSTLKSLVTKTTITLPQALGGMDSSWCTWGWCTISPRLYHEPLSAGRSLVGWTDSSGNGHVSILSASGALEATHNFATTSVRGLTAHADGSYAVLLWDEADKIMLLSKRNANGSEAWTTNIDGSLTSFDSGIGDSRLAFGKDRYAAYFAVFGDSGWVQGHNGDQLTYVDSSGIVQSGGWEWGCSHSMAELISYHPALDQFAPICSSDCYASKGILVNDSQVIYASDGTCSGWVSAQLGQVTFDNTSWKLVFNAMTSGGFTGKGIGLATVDSSFSSSYVWLTNTSGASERDPVIARLGSDLQSNRYLVGWTTTDNGTYWLGVIDGSGSFVAGPEEASSTGISWGNRDDSLRGHADGSVTWISGDPNGTTLYLYRFNGAAFLTKKETRK